MLFVKLKCQKFEIINNCFEVWLTIFSAFASVKYNKLNMATEAAKLQKKQEKIIGDFQILRNEQRNLASKLSTLEMDLKEHKTVIETLKTIDENRKCFRLIGGVLCERKVKDVLPQLVDNRENLQKTIDIVTEQLQKKGLELNKFKDEHNIKVRGQEPTSNDDSESKDKTDDTNQMNRNVLVSN